LVIVSIEVTVANHRTKQPRDEICTVSKVEGSVLSGFRVGGAKANFTKVGGQKS
jgi:hypothetical protein